METFGGVHAKVGEHDESHARRKETAVAPPSAERAAG